MKPVSKYNFPFALQQRAINLTAICIVTTALAACGGSSGGGSEVGGSNETDDLFTDPDLDTDGDGLSDLDEETIYFTDPLTPDSDGDLISDREEVDLNLDPNDPSDGDGDLDSDGVSNTNEFLDGTDPSDPNDFIAGNIDTTTPVASSCIDTNSSNSDWGDNCLLRDGGTYATSSYTQGVQRILWCQGNGLGLTFDGFADGIFGPNTARSVREFQTDRGLLVDGIVGPETWGALFDTLNRNPIDDFESAGTTYESHSIDGICAIASQFYQEVSGIELRGWRMAAEPGSFDLVDFSVGAPN